MRKVKPGCVNVFRFRALSSRLNCWIGLEQLNPKYEWWFRLKDGKRFESEDNQWIEFSNTANIKSGDIIQMTVDGENLSFKVNDRDLGVCFTDPKFKGNDIYPCVFIIDVQD